MVPRRPFAFGLFSLLLLPVVWAGWTLAAVLVAAEAIARAAQAPGKRPRARFYGVGLPPSARPPLTGSYDPLASIAGLDAKRARE